MPEITGVRCDAKNCNKIHIKDQPIPDTWHVIWVGKDDVMFPTALISAETVIEPSNPADYKKEYVCSTKCFLARVSEVMKFDPADMHRTYDAPLPVSKDEVGFRR